MTPAPRDPDSHEGFRSDDEHTPADGSPPGGAGARWTGAVLYTDGLVESRGRDLDDGMGGLTSTVADLAGRDHEQLCDALLDLVDRRTEDDAALLAFRVGGTSCAPTAGGRGVGCLR
ncbi:SpoIIE family protein phosphatase [Blastococcus sp. SYSU DS0973]